MTDYSLRATNTYEVGVIGAGFVAQNLHLPILFDMDDTEIAYVADIDADRARSAGESFATRGLQIDEPEASPKCDIALLTVPMGQRESYIRVFSERSTPLFVEKPFARTLQTHESYTNADIPIFCNYMRACFSTTQQLKWIVRSGMFGRLQAVDCREESKLRATGLPAGHYQTDPGQAGGGIVTERGSHVLSQLVEVFPEEFEIQDAQIRWNGKLDAEVEARLSGTETGTDLVVRLSGIDPIGELAEFRFEHATVRFAPSDPQTRVMIDPGTGLRSMALDAEPGWATTNHQATFLRWRQFISVLEGASLDCLHTAPHVTKLIEDIYTTAEDE